MSPSKPNPPSPPPINDVLAKMMQAEVNEGGPPPATPCDTPAEIIAHIHMADPEPPAATTTSGNPTKKAERKRDP